MTNEEVARLLETISELYEIVGENPFKARAYLRAAQSIRSLPENIVRYVSEGKLENIPGIGKSIAEQVKEFLKTGSMPVLEELKKKVPLELVSLLQVPYVGPKTARILYENLGITNVEDLKEAVLTGKIKEVKGIGSKTIQKIKKALLSKEIFTQRLLLNEAEEIANRVVSFLTQSNFQTKVVPAGSLRRGKETVGDIDFVVYGKDARKAIKALAREIKGEEVFVEGEEIIRLSGKSGLQLDFLLTEKEKFGASLVHLTGSKEHNIRLRQMAKKMGGRLTHEGYYDAHGNLKKFSTEEELYEFLGLSWIPPELREDSGEIEAAQKREIPELLELREIKGDLHIHSDWSDSSASIIELADIAFHLGYEYIAITDHAKRLAVARGLLVDEIEARNKIIDEVNAGFGGRFYVLKGIELNIGKDGEVDYDEEILKKFDFCIASLHWSLAQSRKETTERIIKAMQNPYVDAIGHPTTRLLLRRQEADIDFEEVFSVARETKTFFEINSFPDRLDLPPRLIRLAKKYGIKFVIGTDAHAVAHLSFIKYGVLNARRGWLSADDVLNTLPARKVIEEINKRRTERMKLNGWF